MWRRGIPWKCHPAVDLHNGIDGCVDNRSGFGEEEDRNTGEVEERERR